MVCCLLLLLLTTCTTAPLLAHTHTLRSIVIFSEALMHGAQPWVASHQRRTLLYRFAAQGFTSGYRVAPPWAESLSPLGKAIMEPPHQGSRPDLAALIAEEEAEEAEAA